MVTWYWSADSLIWQMSIDHNMMPYIKKVHREPRLYVSVNLIIWRMAAILRDFTVVVVVVRTRPRAIPLVMINMRKLTHGFPFLFLYEYGTPLGGPSGHRSSANRELKQPRRRCRVRRQVKNEFIFYQRNSQFSRSVRCANGFNNVLELNVQWRRVIPNENAKY